MTEPGLRRFDHLRTSEPKETVELEFDAAIERIAADLIPRLLAGERVLGMVYANSDMGKTHFAKMLLERIRTEPNLVHLLGGEVKGFDEITPQVREFQLMLFQILGLMPSNVGTDIDHREKRRLLENAELPTKYFTTVILAPQLYPKLQPQQYAGRVDYIVINRGAKPKHLPQ